MTGVQTCALPISQNPELSALPVWWTVDEQDGISMGMRTRPDAGEIVSAVAAALGLAVQHYDSVPGTGQFLSAKGTLHGLPIFVSGRTPRLTEGGAE